MPGRRWGWMPLMTTIAALGFLLSGLGIGRLLHDDRTLAVGFALLVGGVAYSAGWLGARRLFPGRGPGGATSSRVRPLDDPGRLVDLAPSRWPLGRLGLVPAVLAGSVVGIGIILGVTVVGGSGWLPFFTGAGVLAASVAMWRLPA